MPLLNTIKAVQINQETQPGESGPQFQVQTSPITDSPSADNYVEIEEAAPKKKKKGGGALIAVAAIGLLLVLKK